MPRPEEDRWFSFGMNSVDALTQQRAGEKVTYSIGAGVQSFVTPEAVIDPAAAAEAKAKGLEHMRRTIDFDWSNIND